MHEHSTSETPPAHQATLLSPYCHVVTHDHHLHLHSLCLSALGREPKMEDITSVVFHDYEGSSGRFNTAQTSEDLFCAGRSKYCTCHGSRKHAMADVACMC